MSRWFALLLPVVMLPSLCSVAADEAVTPSPLIVLPLEPSIEPAPAAEPEPVSVIKPDEWYVIGSQVPLIVISSPDGILRIDHESGPMRLRGKFAGGTGVESRTYTDPHLYFVEPLKSGKSELILIPEGVTDAAAIVRQVLTVAGLGPNPPPDDDPVPPQPTVGKLWIAIVEDAQNRSPQTAICLNALVGWNELKDRGHDWRIYDDQTGEAKGKSALKAASDDGQALPAMVVSDAESGKVLRVLPLPETIEGVKRVVSELTGE